MLGQRDCLVDDNRFVGNRFVTLLTTAGGVSGSTGRDSADRPFSSNGMKNLSMAALRRPELADCSRAQAICKSNAIARIRRRTRV